MTRAVDNHVNNIILGAGEIFINPYSAAGVLGPDERYFGSSPEAALTIETTRFREDNADGPIAMPLVDIPTSVRRAMRIATADMAIENIALFLAGDTPAAEAIDATQAADEKHTISPGRWVQLGFDAKNPRPIGAITESTVVVKKDDGADSPHASDTWTKDDHYKIDEANGRIYAIAGVAGGITANTVIHVTYTPTAKTLETLRLDSSPMKVDAAVRYLENASAGRGRNVYITKASISGTGDFSLKSRDTSQRISLEIGIQAPDNAMHPSMMIDGVVQ